jgi:hypothetical protein
MILRRQRSEAAPASLGAQGDLEDVVGLARAPVGEGGSDARPGREPRRFIERPLDLSLAARAE